MLGIIGGTGLYDLDNLKDYQELEVDTPFGKPSAPIGMGTIGQTQLAFLPRHGKGHKLLPSEINYRANIFALKACGVTQVLSISAVGSLAENVKPGTFALPSQYLDLTKGIRASTFFGKGIVAHVSTAEPVCAGLMDLIEQHASAMSLPIQKNLTYACVEGPRLGTRAESFMLRDLGAQLIGMTNVPEAFLAREAQVCYASIGVVTDYDSWLEDRRQFATAEAVLEKYKASLSEVKRLLGGILDKFSTDNLCSCRRSLEHAFVTPRELFSSEQSELVSILMS